MKIQFRKVLNVLSLALLVSCRTKESNLTNITSSSLSSSSADIYIEKKCEILDNLDYFNIQGRYQLLETGISADYSGSSIEFKADCKGKVSINVKSEINRYDDSAEGKRGLTLFSVFVDGVRTKKNVEVDNKTEDIVLASDLEAGLHTFKFVRQTNVYMSQCSINYLTYSGVLEKNEKNRKYIEFIGDSYTTGYSLQGVKEGGGYDSRYDDPLDAYAYTAAMNLKTDYQLSAFSGAGFAYGYTPFTVPYVYGYQNYFRSNDTFQPDLVPDLIVINLGTNDVSQVRFDNNHAEIEEGVRKLVDATYDAYGSYRPLIFCTDETHENNDSVIREAMDTLLPDVPYKFVSLTTNNHANNYHPDAPCGHIQGEELSEAIKEYLPDVF